jgi:hypothetical protein
LTPISKKQTTLKSFAGMPDFFRRGIPFDPKALKAVNFGLSIADFDCEAGKAAKKVYNNTMGLLS